MAPEEEVFSWICIVIGSIVACLLCLELIRAMRYKYDARIVGSMFPFSDVRGCLNLTRHMLGLKPQILVRYKQSMIRSYLLDIIACECMIASGLLVMGFGFRWFVTLPFFLSVIAIVRSAKEISTVDWVNSEDVTMKS